MTHPNAAIARRLEERVRQERLLAREDEAQRQDRYRRVLMQAAAAARQRLQDAIEGFDAVLAGLQEDWVAPPSRAIEKRASRPRRRKREQP